MGWTAMTAGQSLNSTKPFAVLIAPPADYTTLDETRVKAGHVNLVARFCASGGGFIGMHLPQNRSHHLRWYRLRRHRRCQGNARTA
jgi:ethanolamine utilization microcompartment shell protein EutL